MKIDDGVNRMKKSSNYSIWDDDYFWEVTTGWMQPFIRIIRVLFPILFLYFVSFVVWSQVFPGIVHYDDGIPEYYNFFKKNPKFEMVAIYFYYPLIMNEWRFFDTVHLLHWD